MEATLAPKPTTAVSTDELSMPGWVTRLTPHPGELAHGYEGRLSLTNGFSSPATFFKRVYDTKPGVKKLSRVEFLALCAGMPIEEFVCQHTTAPFARAFADKHYQTCPHGKGEFLLRNMAMRLKRTGSQFCEHCARDDIEHWGYAYWRRIHQVPGVDYCLMHRVPLTTIEKGTFDDSPPTGKDPSGPDSVGVPPFIEKYVLIVEALLSRKATGDMNRVRHFVSSRACKLGLRTEAMGQRPLLSDLTSEIAPTEWLFTVLPGFQKKRPLTILPFYDGVALTAQRPCVQACVVALAVTLDHPDQVFTVLDTPTPPSAQANAAMTVCNWNGEEVTRAYLRHKGRHDSIAEEFGVTPEVARRALDAAGLPNLTDALQAALPAVEALFSGASLSDASSECGVPIEHVEFLLRHNMYRLKKFMESSAGPH